MESFGCSLAKKVAIRDTSNQACGMWMQQHGMYKSKSTALVDLSRVRLRFATHRSSDFSDSPSFGPLKP